MTFCVVLLVAVVGAGAAYVEPVDDVDAAYATLDGFDSILAL
jgi:hypothetical protein